MIIVSACLCGEFCRYDGGAKPDEEVINLLREGRAVPVCPEQLGGLSTPRSPSEIVGGDGTDVILGKAKVLSKEGADVTGAFLKGAKAVLKIAENHGAKKAILKAGSPSCGKGLVYDGSFSGRLKPGDGVTAALLCQNGIKVTAK
ncbi:MAG: hypothetical protein BWY11_01524 [Firmicutes bacterium ADurb.Bin182]|nr:MAG: hypothetical protein BWY11_01524 [Firmicutes bacterium ADurb.Bin182]